ncbi:cytidyltransferase domain protein, partial [Ostertagia ostertagi]
MSNKNVWVDGRFEMVHFGDVYQLREAKKFGGSVVVGMHTDEEIKRSTGYQPVFNADERYRLLSQFEVRRQGGQECSSPRVGGRSGEKQLLPMCCRRVLKGIGRDWAPGEGPLRPVPLLSVAMESGSTL